MTHWLRSRSNLWLLIGLLTGPIVSVELPAEAQRYSVRRARRARQARLHRERARERREAEQQTPDTSVDMDFTAHDDDERPPPMDTSYVQEVEEQEQERRRSMLDPELFGENSNETEPAVRERGRYIPLNARMTIGAFHRALTYRAYRAGAVSDYDLPLGAAVSIGVDYYPAAHVLNDAFAHLALSWSFAHSIGVQSTSPEGISYPTNAYAWQIGLRYRIPIDTSEIGLEAGGGEHGFHVERGALSDPGPSGAPPVDYDLLRFAITGRFAIGDAALGGRIAYLPVLGSGMLGDARYFGGVDTHGVEAAIDFTYALGFGFEVLAEVDMRLFVLDFAENAGGEAVAASAVDRYIAGRLGVRWSMPAHADL